MAIRIRLKISIISTILLITTIFSAAMLISLWLLSSNVAESVARDLFNTASQSVRIKINGLMDASMRMASSGAHLPGDLSIKDIGPDHVALPVIYSALEQDDTLYSLYYGFKDGSFLQVIEINGDKNVRDSLKAPDGTHWIVRKITGQTGPSDGRQQYWHYLDENRQLIQTRSESNPDYDPRERPWYRESEKQSKPKLSPAYIYNSNKKTGITASAMLTNKQGVFGADIVLESLSSFISELKVSPNDLIVLFDKNKRILAASDNAGQIVTLSVLGAMDIPSMNAVLTQHKESGTVDFTSTVYNDTKYLISIDSTDVDGENIYTAIIAPQTDFVSHIQEIQKQVLYLYLIGLLIFTPLALVFSAYLSKSVSSLIDEAKRVQNMDFSREKPVSSRILEFYDLGQAFHHMKKSLQKNTSELKLSQDKLGRLVELGIAMSSEQQNSKLLDMVLSGAKELTNADGGTIYTIGDDNELHFQIVKNDSLGIEMGGLTKNPINIPNVKLVDEEGKPNHKNVVSYTVHREETINIPDAYNNENFDFSGTKIFDESNNYKSTSFLTVPLKPRGGDVIGALQIINAIDPETNETIPFSNEIQRFVEALAAQAATAIYNRDLLRAQEELLDSMIKLLAGAIDTKSPYTGGHCERVPELAFMLAEKACDEDTGPLADFSFTSEGEWKEFQIGAWLHDCGKVVTPEYVVDKATKLETIYNRIHEIRARFEILLRDSEIAGLKSIIGGAAEDKALQELANIKEQLTDDYMFIAKCNIGGEFLRDEDVARIQSIANTEWTRNFDERAGLSHEELSRFQGEGITPATEKLLDNKHNHIIPHTRDLHVEYADSGFDIEIPDNLYNIGEVYNLTASRGTLTDEERFKINEHVMQTIAMLESLPLPKHLKRIPEYAGTHHETLSGTGYPRKLTEDDLSVPSRIMAIADVFEALTASDRPYKKAKTLSEPIHILSGFKTRRHIDGDLFDLFLTSGIYKEYAEKYLKPEQIDDVEIEQYLG